MAYDPKVRPTAIDVVRILRAQLFDNKSTKENIEIVQVEPVMEEKPKSVASSTTASSSSHNANINCPQCKESNSRINESCVSCNKVLLNAPAKINISVKRLQNANIDRCADARIATVSVILYQLTVWNVNVY
ncbi:hypothetical protein THRCLA_20846 [Thraustotheca clavata]|uniref:Uncharacterized protein n=1 Tax=Thraustotheca clavata TaxID=74557 RepID=A0A1W0A3F7_9STRA|nr:hypothetical protein THRCLA_20846 [Thraustotheca clavata]